MATTYEILEGEDDFKLDGSSLLTKRTLEAGDHQVKVKATNGSKSVEHTFAVTVTDSN